MTDVRDYVYRIAHMLESGIPQSQILALTFTNKAALEMEQKLIKLFTEHPDVLARLNYKPLRTQRVMGDDIAVRKPWLNPLGVIVTIVRTPILLCIILYAQ